LPIADLRFEKIVNAAIGNSHFFLVSIGNRQLEIGNAFLSLAQPASPQAA
jgi:hypothetical protein